jgi:acetyl-CoA carboxylase biotin carboxyl carrier protein
MPEGTGIQVDTALVRELAELLESSHLTEIEVKDGDRTIRVARTAGRTAAYAPRLCPATAAVARRRARRCCPCR